MPVPSRLLRAAGALLLLLPVLVTAPAEAASPCPETAPGGGTPPLNITNPMQAPSTLPTGLPSTGGGGEANACRNDPNCSGDSGSSGGFDTGGQPTGDGQSFAFAGSAPGRGHGSLLMLAFPAHVDQAAGCDESASPSGDSGPPAGDPGAGTGPGAPPSPPPPPVPCPPPPGPPALPDPRAVAGGIALPWPAFQIRAKPDSVGLDGLPSWFWLEGYDGRPIAATQHLHLDGRPSPQPGCPAGPPADEDVGVRAVPGAYMWRVGDDDRSLATTSLGVP